MQQGYIFSKKKVIGKTSQNYLKQQNKIISQKTMFQIAEKALNVWMDFGLILNKLHQDLTKLCLFSQLYCL